MQPKLSTMDSIDLSRAIRRAAILTDLSWDILLSVAYHESSLNRHAVNHKTHDYGVMQISENTIIRLNLNKERVIKDLDYNVYVGAQILKYNRAHYGTSNIFWLGIYRSGTALTKTHILLSAIRYDTMIRATAEKLRQREKTNRMLAANEE